MKHHTCHDSIPSLEFYFAVTAAEEAHHVASKQIEKVTVFTAIGDLEQLEREFEAIVANMHGRREGVERALGGIGFV